MIENYKNKFTGIHFLLAIALIAPKIGLIDWPVIFMLIIVFLTFLKSKLIIKLPKKFYQIALLWGFLIFLSALTFLSNDKVDPIFFLKPFRQILLLALAIIIVKSNNIKLIEFFYVIVIAALLNSTLIGIQLIGHNFFKIQNFLILSNFDMVRDVPFRKPGFMAGYPHSGFLSVIGMYCLLSFAKFWNRSTFVVIWVLFTLTLIVTSRAAFLAGIVPSILFFLMGMKSKIVFKKLSYYSIIGISTIIYLVSILPINTYRVAFEMFINFSENKGFTTASSSALLDSFYFPSHLSTYFFGNGDYMRNDMNLNVDDGFQIMLYGCGIFYLLISLLIYIYYAYLSSKGTEIEFQKKLIIFIFMTILFFNLKSDMIFSRVFSDIFAFLVAIGLLNNQNTVSQKVKILFKMK
mgnify:CR=1 FL=1